MEGWVKLAPTMGLSDFITADATFDQLASLDESADDERSIKYEVLNKYCERITSKAAPGLPVCLFVCVCFCVSVSVSGSGSLCVCVVLFF
jgi:hypothetical protein